MSTLLVSMLALPTAIFGLLLFTRISAFFRPTEKHNGVPRPPHMPHWVPFVGNALNMASGDAFSRKVVERVGPAARITAMGETRTFVMSQGLIAYVYKNSKNFDFLWFRKHMQCIIFGMKDHKASFSSVWDDKVFAAHHRNMQPGAIIPAIKKYGVELEKRFTAMLEEKSHGGDVDFFDAVWDVIYTASSKAWFGDSFPAAASVKAFKAFDVSFPILNLTTLPGMARKPAVQTMETMLTFLEEWWATVKKDEKARKEIAPALMAEIEASEEEGFTERDLAAIMLAELWALEANAPIMAIWTSVEIVRHSEIIPSLRQEVDEAIAGLSPPTLSSLLSLTQPEILARLPKINAAFQETLRLYTDTCSLRVVQEDCVLPANLCAGGPGEETGLALVKGEHIVCTTRKLHIDGNWGDDAEKWDHARWLGGRAKGSMHPFGGGVSMCEGRHFSSAEILTFLASFVYLTDVEVTQDTMTTDRTRVGLGVIPIKGNMRVRFRTRPTAAL